VGPPAARLDADATLAIGRLAFVAMALVSFRRWSAIDPLASALAKIARRTSF